MAEKNCTMLPVCGFGLAVDTSGIEAGLSREEVQAMIDETVALIPASDGINYSLEEQWTGRYWVDGKKIYQKTINVPGTLGATLKSIEHNIPNIERIVRQETSSYGLSQASGEVMFHLSPTVSSYVKTGEPAGTYIGFTKTHIKYLAGASGAHYSSHINTALQYTCTDR